MSTMPKAEQPEKADYEILVKLQKGYAVPEIPRVMDVGKTVHYTSNDGAVTITFPANHSPFLTRNGNKKLKITSNERPIKLSTTGEFTCRCSIKPPGRPAVVWTPDSPAAGGNFEVK
jgi:hypothetical protein